MASGSVAVAMALLLVGCAKAPVGNEAPTPCEQVVPDCHAKRLPNVTLKGNARSGALGTVNESLDGTISFDEALAAAGREDGHPDAETVQVVLGSADATALHWDSKGDLFYAIDWSGVCMYSMSGNPRGPHSSTGPTGCTKGAWGSVIDAHTGGFIVGGNG